MHLPHSRSVVRLVSVLSFALTLSLNPLGGVVHIEEVDPHPTLPRQYAPGSTATLATFDSLPADATFQWTHNDVPIPGATDSSLTLSSLSSQHSGNYRLIVTANGISEPSIETLPLNVLPFPTSALDPSFTSDLTSPQSARPIGFTADGGILVETTSAGVREIAHLDSTGKTSSSFTLPELAGTVLAALPNGGVIASAPPYRYNSDGSVGALTLPSDFDPTKPLSAAAVLPDGKFYLAQQSALNRFNADGSLDPTFSPPANSDNIVAQSLVLDPSGRLYATVVITVHVSGSEPT